MGVGVVVLAGGGGVAVQEGGTGVLDTCSPELLDEVLALLDDVERGLQRGRLLLLELLNELLDGVHRVGAHLFQQLLLKVLHPGPQLSIERQRDGGWGVREGRERERQI